jgi:hypothetical protein
MNKRIKQEMKRREQIAVVPKVDWNEAKIGLSQLYRELGDEIGKLIGSESVRNAYSPVTWWKICRYIEHITEGLMVVRLSNIGLSPTEIFRETGIVPNRTAAFRAWATRFKGDEGKSVTIDWRTDHERKKFIDLMDKIGIRREPKNI